MAVSQTVPFAMVPRSLFEDEEMDAHCILVYGALATYANGVREATPSHQAIGRRAKISERSVRRAMVKLTMRGWVIVSPRYTEHGDRTSNHYHLPMAVTQAGGGATQTPPPPAHRHHPPVTVAEEQEPMNKINETLAPSAQASLPSLPPDPDPKPRDHQVSRSTPGAKRIQEPPDRETTELRKHLQDAFVAGYEAEGGERADINWRKEGSHVTRLIERCMTRGDPQQFADQLLETFGELIRDGDRFWRGQVFLPSVLASEGIYHRVVKELNGHAAPEPKCPKCGSGSYMHKRDGVRECIYCDIEYAV